MRLFPKGRRDWLAFLGRLAGGVLLLGGAGVLMLSMPGHSHRGPLPALSVQETAVRDSLRLHVDELAVRIGERHMDRPQALAAGADYVEKAFQAIGLEVTQQAFTVEQQTVKNLEVQITGTSRPEQIIVVGAHYDTVVGTPGANDNATGMAALLELARMLKARPSGRTVRCVAFVNEEPPYFRTDQMGSRVYARQAKAKGERIVAMIALDCLGCYSDNEQSQFYPRGFASFYPTTGNFIGFVGNLSSRGLARRCIRVFRQTTAFPSEGAALPGWVTGAGWSDHWSFWQEGYPAVMVTDTGPFRYPCYHTALDTADKVDADRLARVVLGLYQVVLDLASHAEARSHAEVVSRGRRVGE